MKTHGMYYTRTYKIWACMLQRCTNKNNVRYDRYGGRGIKVCKRWYKFEYFYEDMGDAPADRSLDRIDNDRDYNISNCRWATPKEQSNNTRTSRFIEYNGKRLTVAQWARELNISKYTLFTRLRSKWNTENVLYGK